MKSWIVLAVTQAILSPVWAHHSLSAVYDDKKPVSLKRELVTKFDWSNPHVFVYIDVQATNWAFEFDSRIELRRSGWTQNSLQVGDVVSIEGNSARDGSKRVNGKLVTLANGKKLSTVQPPPQASALAGKPAPHWPGGHVRLGPAPGDVGYWANPSVASLIENTAGNIRMNSEGLLANIADAAKVAPFQPWAKGLYEYRASLTLLKEDDPMAVLSSRPAARAAISVERPTESESSSCSRSASAIFVLSHRWEPQLASHRHGRFASLESRRRHADLFRLLFREMGRRYAHHRHSRSRRALLVL